MASPISVEMKGDIAWVTIDHPPVNATSTVVRAGLLRAVQDVQNARLAVLRCAGATFVAGGDMSEFDAPAQEPHLPDVVNAIEASNVPFVALLHGTVLGGGLEIAMACAFRVAHPKTRFGLPEVNVGLVPGAGGTQRAPRLFGWNMAFEMASLGQLKTEADLKAVGALNVVTEDLESAVNQFLGQKASRVSERVIGPMSDTQAAEFLQRAERAAKGWQAPSLNLGMLKLASEPFYESQPKERALHLELRNAPESNALRHQFFAERAVTKPAIIQDVSSGTLSQIAIVGGGLMGSGIAAACLMAGFAVTLIERDIAAADMAHQTVTSLLNGAVKRGKITAVKCNAQLDRLTTTDSYGHASSADLAIEAVFEDLTVKRNVMQRLAGVMREDAILATNTSYLNPDHIFEGLGHLNRCVGIHFFSPAHIMKLVEVVQTSNSSAEALVTAFSFAKSLHKTPVLSGICDGFIGNRILAAYRRAAEYMLADGALPKDIDAAMRKFGMAMGPFEAQDLSGLQIAFAHRRRQDATRDPNERYVTISDQLCALGRFGKRSGKGWYAYQEGSRTGTPDDKVEALIMEYSAKTGIARRSYSEDEVQTQLLAAMANEGAKIVEEGIAENAAAVDVVKVSGYGFPRHRGGPMHWAEHAAPGVVSKALRALDSASPGSWIRAIQFSNI